MNIEVIRNYVALVARKRQMAADLKVLTHEVVLLSDSVIDEIQNSGARRVEVDGVNVSIHEDIFVSQRGTPDEMLDALRASDLAQYIAPESCADKSLNKYVRDLWLDLRGDPKKPGLVTERDLRAAIPEALNGLLKISFVYKLGA